MSYGAKFRIANSYQFVADRQSVRQIPILHWIIYTYETVVFVCIAVKHAQRKRQTPQGPRPIYTF